MTFGPTLIVNCPRVADCPLEEQRDVWGGTGDAGPGLTLRVQGRKPPRVGTREVRQLDTDREVAGGARRLERHNLLTREPPMNDNEALATGVLDVNPQHE
jgi:hypothetical protein